MKDDSISRQAAIDALDAVCDRECEYSKQLFIQQNGDNNTILPNYGTVNLTIGGKKGAADE